MPVNKMHDYDKIRRAFMYGMSAIAYYKVVLPEIDQLQRVAQDMDSITNLMLKRGDLIPPTISFKNQHQPNSSLDVNGNYSDNDLNFRY